MVANPTLTVNVDTPSGITDPPYVIIGSGSVIGTDWVAPELWYVDKTTKARGFTIMRGTSNPDQLAPQYDVGTATVLFDNSDRAFDPASNPDITPGQGLQITATWNATLYSLFTGVVDQWLPTYPAFAKDSVTVASANDGLTEAAKLEVKFRADEETTGRRARRYADLLAWPPSLRDIDTGSLSMSAGRPGISALEGLYEAARSEFGDVFIQGDGTLRFRDQSTTLSGPTSLATFGDSGSELRYSEPEPIPFSQLIRNDITVTYDHQGDTVSASDGASIVTNGDMEDQLETRSVDASTAQGIADLLLARFKDPVQRFATITIKPRRDPATLWPQALGRELGDCITVKLTPPGGGSRISRLCFIRGIHHQVSAMTDMADWTTTFYLSDASKW